MLRRSAAPRMLVTFVRHSESENNVLNARMNDKRAFYLVRQSDPPLTARGVQQAELAAERIARENADATLVVTSYFHRALRTAAAIEGAMHANGSTAQTVVDARFHEVGGEYVSTDPGHPDLDLIATGLPGRTTADVAREFPSFVPVDPQASAGGWWKSAKKETLAEARARALGLWARLTEFARAPAGADAAAMHTFKAPAAAGPPTIVSIVDGAAAEKRNAALARAHESIVVVMHGHLYSVMMNEACAAGLFVGDVPQQFNRLTNTGITRLELTPSPMGDAGRPCSLAVRLANCDAHVRHIGTLESAALPLQ